MLISAQPISCREMIFILHHRSEQLFSGSPLVYNHQQKIKDMKNKIQNILLLAVLLLAVGCSKKLDTTPRQSIDEKDALKTPSDVQVALVGAYADMGDAD